ncbi:MAG: DUF1553 domain-containing protein [Chitinophagaceae bacterium]|nr:DUF1553 domain-containing protein [Chitinophagaceae bacterium]
MRFAGSKKILVVVSLLVIGILISFRFTKDELVDFNAEVKPILNKKCITCHGGVKAKAGFSVLFREDALANTESGKPAIIPGDPANSEMIRRINLNDPEERMPYRHEPLSDREINILTRWIRQGAKWGDHWAYLPVQKTSVPPKEDPWIKNDVDRFIFERLKENKLSPSQQAGKAILLRRVSLDLIGMYPPQEIAGKYLSNPSEKAYEILVDSLLESKHYGERWAAMWLDLARYADTKGYEADVGREIWKYRDWVIGAFNEDKPYDQFLIQQIAGDLLPDPLDADYIATAFSRNSMTNDEGGTDNEEFRTAAVLDRVNTTWEALMGTTFSCVQCHSHPYDPFRHEEYYSFVSYFNNSRDEDQPGDYPLLRTFNDTLSRELETVTNWVKKYSDEDHSKATKHFLRTWQPAIYANTADSLVNTVIDGNNSDLLLRNNALFRLKKVDLRHADELVFQFNPYTKNGILKLHMDSPDGEVIASIKPALNSKWQISSFPSLQQAGIHDIYFSYSNTSVPVGNQDFHMKINWISFNRQLPGKDQPGYKVVLEKYRSLMKAQVPTTPVMVENPTTIQRATHVFERGNRLTLGKKVEPGVPKSLSMAMPANAPKNRMGLSLWLTNKNNPLVSRTIVNRLWEQLFGTGIAETLEDMGTQGIPPTHKELIDHYAYQLMHDYNWSLKKLLKEFVMSATYRQDSKLTPELREKDPYNKWYARGPRLRLSAEQLRDQHLCISGMMSDKMYGKSVMPWQPSGIWNSPYNGSQWLNSSGEDRYRRAVYTYWKRSSPYPSMISFDGAQRVVCNARRIRTNTPLQALVTLNDSAYVDMAAQFAKRMMREGGKDVKMQISKGYEIMLYASISPEKLKLFMELYHTAFNEFSKDKSSAYSITGEDKELSTAEGAALMVVANALLNLDEVVMKN